MHVASTSLSRPDFRLLIFLFTIFLLLRPDMGSLLTGLLLWHDVNARDEWTTATVYEKYKGQYSDSFMVTSIFPEACSRPVDDERKEERKKIPSPSCPVPGYDATNRSKHAGPGRWLSRY